MKLRIRIFLSFLTISLTVLLICSSYLINRSHMTNVVREQERSISEFEFILSSLRSNIDFNASSTDSIQVLLSRYGDYYIDKGIHFLIYRNQELLYDNLNVSDSSLLSGILSVHEKERIIQILKDQGKHYFFVSGTVSADQNSILVYARNIEQLYLDRTQYIRFSVVFAAGLILLLSILFFFYSRWITNPIIRLQKGAAAISAGNYSVRIPKSKDEFNSLGEAFNRMAEAVQLHTMQLEDRARELQVFIDDLSHEMNTPLTSIQGYSEFLYRANATQDQRNKAVETIRSEAVRMKDIYTKLMTLSFTRENELELTDVKLTEFFEQLKDTFLTQLQEQQINFEISCSISTLKFDQTLLYMLISNLIKNSLQALSPKGTIRLMAYEESGYRVLAVADNGIGIPRDKISEVIKPFYRVDKSRSRKTGGAGLGLSICSTIVKLHQAELIIDSTPGEGTLVKIIFPNA